MDSVAAAYGPSLALAPDGSPRISYLDLAASRLRFAARDPNGWNLEVLSSVGYTQTSLALASDGRVLIACPNSLGAGGGLRLATWEDGQWGYEAVDGGYYTGAWLALVLDTVEQPQQVVFVDPPRWRISTVDSTGNVGQDASLVLDQEGRAHIVYRDALVQAVLGHGTIAVTERHGTINDDLVERDSQRPARYRAQAGSGNRLHVGGGENVVG